MGANCASIIDGGIPNLNLICYQAVENELVRRQDWLFKKITEMTKLRKDAVLKAKDYIKNKELTLAVTSAKAALMEDQKLSALNPIKEKLAKSINDLAAERKQEESQSMTMERLKSQMSMKPIEKLKDLVMKWVSQFEDMLSTPVSSLSFVDELEKDLKSNPLELFAKLQGIADFGDVDLGVIDSALNPEVKALTIARKVVEEKNTSVDTDIREYRVQKDKCLAQAKESASAGNYMNALMLVKTLPVLEAKVKCGDVVKKGLSEEIKEMDKELNTKKTKSPTLDELKNVFSKDQVTAMSDVVTKWMGKQQEIASKLVTSPSEMMSTMSSPISMNVTDIVKELNASGVLPKIDIASSAMNAAGKAAGSLFGKFT